MEIFGEPILKSEAVLIRRAGEGDATVVLARDEDALQAADQDVDFLGSAVLYISYSGFGSL